MYHSDSVIVIVVHHQSLSLAAPITLPLLAKVHKPEGTNHHHSPYHRCQFTLAISYYSLIIAAFCLRLCT
ncbi:hypothetical protein B0O99DRAFT_632052 [Bisporella sp. PMI_857]|nr:hypothetical protein B0O99DRAFT_632052 [Bisporella sp. PMI_857]